MAFQTQQISDYGTTNPIVARLSLQTTELSKFYSISEKQKEELFGIMFSEVQPKLMICFRIKEHLTAEIRAHQKSVEEKGLNFQAQGRAYTLPSILELRHHAETFLYNAKSALRDFTAVFLVLFAKDFKKEARFDKVLKWAKDQFGNEDILSKALEEDQATWIAKIVKMRNAVEHPGGYSGVLHIENFTGREKESVVVVTEPVWHLNSDPKTRIAHEMDVMVTNLLSFFEETLLLCLGKFPSPFPIAVQEIPESERDPKCPLRFRMVMNMAELNSQSGGRLGSK